MFAIQSTFCQLPIEDIGVRDVHFVDAPLIYPGVVAQAGFEFYADSGATLNGLYDIGCSICVAELDFAFTNPSNIIAEMSGDGLILWQDWQVVGTCMIGTISVDLPVGSSGYVFFPVTATSPNPQGTPYYAANLININLQPHPYDPSNDSNDFDFNWTYTVDGEECEEDIFVTGTLSQNTIDASNSISSDVVLDQSTPIVFNSGSTIDLMAGFEVKLGTEFTANIQSCN